MSGRETDVDDVPAWALWLMVALVGTGFICAIVTGRDPNYDRRAADEEGLEAPPVEPLNEKDAPVASNRVKR